MTNRDAIKSLEENLGIPNIVARILVQRGVKDPYDAEMFLFPKLKDLSDPSSLPDLDKGIHRIIMAIKKRERICIYGDYDADGVTSVALMINFLKSLNISPSIYIPDRKEGYGLNIGAIKKLNAEGASLIICLDCGSSNLAEIKFANDLGIDVIVIDHHELSGEMPSAYALINPKRKDSLFATRDLAACGVTFFVLWALRRALHNAGLLDGQINLKKELDLVTLGTIGDMVPLVKDNRIITKIGIETMRKKPRQWLKTFYKKNLIPRADLNEFALNFIIIPRINATGRVSEPEKSLNFLICDSEDDSDRYLTELHDANDRRQQIGGEILKECMDAIEKNRLSEKNSIVLFNKDWHIGVIGIVAQKLAETFGKPSMVITEVEGVCKGSGRGVEGFNLYETLTSFSDLLIKFGGHRYACGFSLTREKLGAFSQALEDALELKTNPKKTGVAIDTQADLEELTPDCIGFIEGMAPFGIGNPRPNIQFNQVNVSLVNNGRVKITDQNKRVWYGYLQGTLKMPETADALNIIASPVLREERGNRYINLNIKAIESF